MRVHIFGSSGSGTTSLGKALANILGVQHFDSDDYYWKKTDPPYTEKQSVNERCQYLLSDMSGLNGCVLSGSMDSWSEAFVPLFDLIIFVSANADIRAERLRERESHAFGGRALPGGDMYEDHEYFIRWAKQYEEGRLAGRSKIRHEKWMESLEIPVHRLVNKGDFQSLVNDVCALLID